MSDGKYPVQWQVVISYHEPMTEQQLQEFVPPRDRSFGYRMREQRAEWTFVFYEPQVPSGQAAARLAIRLTPELDGRADFSVAVHRATEAENDQVYGAMRDIGFSEQELAEMQARQVAGVA